MIRSLIYAWANRHRNRVDPLAAGFCAVAFGGGLLIVAVVDHLRDYQRPDPIGTAIALAVGLGWFALCIAFVNRFINRR